LSSFQPFPSEMFGAFALDVSNFQAGSFGTPAFFLAAFSDILPDLIAHHLMTASRAVIPSLGEPKRLARVTTGVTTGM